MKNKRRLVG